MPEGDTIYLAAKRLKPVLEGQLVQRAESREISVAETLVGQRVTQVEARGKHLLFHFSDGRVLHSHMGMTGSWHIYRPNETWQKPKSRAAIMFECPLHVVVCFTPKTLELLTAAGLRRHRHLSQLGPDVLSESFHDVEVLRRFRMHNATAIGCAVLDQSILSGIGNVYKSELLFLLHLHPLTRVQQLSDDELLALIARSREVMQKNLQGKPRTTRHALDGRRFWLYGRSGEPCFICGSRIEMIRQSDLGRSTYFCPTCQPLRPEADRHSLHLSPV